MKPLVKFCARCNTTHPAEAFGKNKARGDGLATYCRSCTKAYMAAKSYDAERWALHREEESARNKAYREANKARIKPRDRARMAARRRDNPGAVNATNKARKAAQIQATPGWADPVAMQRVYVEAQRLSDHYGVELHVDHVVPLRSKQVCGLHTEANLQLLAFEENMTKGNRTWPDMPEII